MIYLVNQVRNPDLHIIVTTTNSKLGKADNSALTDEHGIQWAHMIKNINDVLKPKYGFAVAAYGGYDAEPDWSSYPATLDWAEGYNQAAYAYYNIGSCEGCARHEPRNDWETNYPYKFRTTQRTYHLSWGLRWARAVPQIYHRDYALEWYNVARYASEQGHNMQFPAIMSSCTTTSCTIDNTSPWQNTGQDDWLSPLQAWQAMYDTFNASTTPESINGQSLNLPNPIRHQIQSSITDFANWCKSIDGGRSTTWASPCRNETPGSPSCPWLAICSLITILAIKKENICITIYIECPMVYNCWRCV